MRALTNLQRRLSLSFGQVVENVLILYYSGDYKIRGNGPRGPQRKKIAERFRHFKTVTIRKDLAVRLLDESKHRAYTCRSFYAGSIFQIVLNRVGFWALLKEIRRRPDLSKAVNYGPTQHNFSAATRLRRRLQGVR